MKIFNGWKQPKGGRWTIDDSFRSLLPPLPNVALLGGVAVAIIVGLVCGIFPKWTWGMFPIIGMALPSPSGSSLLAGNPKSGIGGWDLFSSSSLPYNVMDFGVAAGSTDITQAMEEAVRKLNALGGGRLRVPGGTWQMTRPFPTVTGKIVVEGDSGRQTVVQYSGATTFLAFNYGGAVGTSSDLWGVGLRDITLEGPGVGSGVACLLLGGATGAAGFYAENLIVESWGTAITYGSNAYLQKFVNCRFSSNNQQWVSTGGATNSGEGISFYGCTFANSGTVANAFQLNVAGFSVECFGCSFDEVQFAMSTGTAALYGCHFENPSTTSDYIFVSQTGGELHLDGCHFFQNNAAAASLSFVDQQAGNLIAIANRFGTQGVVIARAFFIGGGAGALILNTKILQNVTTEVVATTTGVVRVIGRLSGAQESTTSPAALAAGNNNDMAFTFHDNFRITGDAGGTSVITGIVAPGSGAPLSRKIRVVNVGAAAFNLGHQNAGSAAANRIISPTGANVPLATDDAAELIYDDTTDRWRITNVQV